MQAQTFTPLLAGTQCTQCGYPSCAAYAEALTQGAPTNLCRPGGARVANAVAEALHQQPIPPAQSPLPPQVLFINEPDCIGCTLCQQKCPTSAIVGAPKQLHTIVADLCTGCGLCQPVCPTNCIEIRPAPPKHPLTQQDETASLTESASTQTWSLVNATAVRKAAPTERTTKTQTAAPQTELAALSPEVLAKIAAARQKSSEKYAAKGPLRTPRALKTPR